METGTTSEAGKQGAGVVSASSIDDTTEAAAKDIDPALPKLEKGVGAEAEGLVLDEDDEESEARALEMKRKTKVVEESPKGRYVRFNEKLGEGAFKKVYRGWDTKNGVEVAWNAVKMSALQRRDGGKRILQEMRILQQLDHPNIIKFYASWLQKEEQTLVFITEIITTGTLKNFTLTRPLRLKILKRWCRHILGAIVYLHSFDPPIIHRDLKCDNIFINGSTGDIRIGDLGLASWQRDGAAQSCLGTPEYMAPELYEEKYDEQVDIYAFGMCVLEMITKQPPYQECASAPQIYRKVIQGILPQSFKMLKDCPTTDLIRWCIGKPLNGAKRPTAQELMECAYLEKPIAENGEDPDGSVDCATFLKTSEDLEEERLHGRTQSNLQRHQTAAHASKTGQPLERLPQPPQAKNPGPRSVLLAQKKKEEVKMIRRTTSPMTGMEHRRDKEKEKESLPQRFTARWFLNNKAQRCVEVVTWKRRSIKFVLETADTAKSLTRELLEERLIEVEDMKEVEGAIQSAMDHHSLSAAQHHHQQQHQTMGKPTQDEARRQAMAAELAHQVNMVRRDLQSQEMIKEALKQEDKLQQDSKLKEIEEKLTGEYNNFLANR